MTNNAYKRIYNNGIPIIYPKISRLYDIKRILTEYYKIRQANSWYNVKRKWKWGN